MAEKSANPERQLLRAISFAARAHHGQMRKDNRTPYVSHVYRVCMVLRDVFGVTDHRLLTAAVLHDTVEDTTTDFDDIEDHFGPDIARWVAALSKDKRQPFDERERDYCRVLEQAEWQVQVCKLADLFDNLLDMEYLDARKRPDAARKKRLYLDALRRGLKPEAQAAWERVARLFEEVEAGLKAAK
ncbi:MAG: HD domain-containing protein [Gemmataceae bacterium]|nr:HD domain-containing protein [Gemmataceae bacterium]